MGFNKLNIIVFTSVIIGSMFYVFKTLEKEVVRNAPIITSVPKNAAIIFQTKAPISIWKNLSETNLIWKNFRNIESIKKLDSIVKKLDVFINYDKGYNDDKQLVFSVYKGGDKPDFLISFSSNNEYFDTIINKLKCVYEDNIYTSCIISNFYIKYNEPFVFISPNKELIKTSIKQIEQKNNITKDSVFYSLYKKSNNKTHIYYNDSRMKSIVTPYFKKEFLENWNSNKEWSSLDVIFNDKKMLLNGLSNILDNKNYKEVSSNIDYSLFPKNIDTKKEYSFNLKNIPSNIETVINSSCNCDVNNIAGKFVDNKFVEFTFGDNAFKAYAVKIKEGANFMETIVDNLNIDSTKINIYGFDLYKLNKSSINSLLGINDNIYITRYNYNLILSDFESIKKLILEIKKNNKFGLENNSYVSFANEYFTQKSNYSFFSNSKAIEKNIKQVIKPQYKNYISSIFNNLEDDFIFAYQTSFLSKNLEHSALVLKNKTNVNNYDNKLWTLKLDNNIASSPQLLKNHRSKSLDIFVQDNKNTIYLINAVGNLKWKKSLTEPIIGKIKQIDVYGNNKYQMIFNTKSHIYLIDINGNNVKGFPIKLSSKATSTISVFDYENNHNYRFMVSCEDLITYNYNKEGNKVKGWNLPKSSNIISKPYKRVVFNNKDYIYNIDTLGNVYFVNRRGEENFKIDKNINASRNIVEFQKRVNITSSSFIYKDNFSKNIVEYGLNNTLLKEIKDTKLVNCIPYDIDNNNFVDYLCVNKNNIEIYGLDKTLVNRLELIENIKSYKIIQDINNKNYIVVELLDTPSVIILDYNLNNILPPNIEVSKKVSIGDINYNGKNNFITVIDGNTIKSY